MYLPIFIPEFLWFYASLDAWPRGYKTLFMLNSDEHEIYPAHVKCHCWHFNIMSIINTTSERLKAWSLFSCRYFSFYEQLKFRVQSSWTWKKFYNLCSWFLFTLRKPYSGADMWKLAHFMIKARNLVHGQISNYQNFWGSVPRQKCILTAAILNFKMATCFHLKPVKQGIILQ